MGGLGALSAIQGGHEWAMNGINFWIGGKRQDQYKSAVRHLRRREYQDMMFSMKKAGLNPILASGATPGHSAAWVAPTSVGGPGIGGLGSAVAQNRQAGVSEKKAPSEIDLNEERKGLTVLERGNAILTGENLAATAKNIEQQTRESGARQLLYEADAKKAGVSAKEIDARRRQIELDMQGRIGGNITADPVGYGKNVLGEAAATAKEGKKWLDSLSPEEIMMLSGQKPGPRY